MGELTQELVQRQSELAAAKAEVAKLESDLAEADARARAEIETQIESNKKKRFRKEILLFAAKIKNEAAEKKGDQARAEQKAALEDEQEKRRSFEEKANAAQNAEETLADKQAKLNQREASFAQLERDESFSRQVWKIKKQRSPMQKVDLIKRRADVDAKKNRLDSEAQDRKKVDSTQRTKNEGRR